MNHLANHERPNTHMRWGNLAIATVILGGAGVVFLGGAQEIAQNGAPAWGVALAMGIAGALLGLLALLYLLNWRAARMRAAMARNPFLAPQKGGFLKGFLLGLLGVFVIHVALFFAAFTPAAPDAVKAVASMALLRFAALYAIVPLVAGWLTRVMRATRI